MNNCLRRFRKIIGKMGTLLRFPKIIFRMLNMSNNKSVLFRQRMIMTISKMYPKQIIRQAIVRYFKMSKRFLNSIYSFKLGTTYKRMD